MTWSGRASYLSLLIHSTLIQAIVFLIRPATSYQALDLGIPVAALGAVGAVFALVPLVLAVPAGGLADRFGAKRVLLLGSVVTVIAAAVLLIFATSLVGIMTGTALLGAGHLGCIVGQQTTVAHSATSGRLDSMFGYYTFSASLGQAIGPLLIPLAGGSGVQPDTTTLFILGLAMSGALLLVSFGVGRVAPEKTERGSNRGSMMSILRMPGVARAIITSAMIVAAVDLTVVYIPALGVERELTAVAVGWLLAVRALASMASRLFLGRAAAWLGRARLMKLSIVLAAISFIVLALPVPQPILFVVAVTLGLGLGVGQPLTMSWVTEQVPASRRGTALAVRLAGNRTAQLTIPAAVGAFAATLGASAVMGGIGVLLGTTLLLLRGVRLDGD